MAHFVKVEEDGLITQAIVVANEDCGGGEFPASEAVGQAFIASLNLEGTWKQTSYNANFRGLYAGIGMKYDDALDEFVNTPVEE